MRSRVRFASVTWREEHLFPLEQAMQRYDFLTRQIDDCEARVMAEIERLTPPDDPPDGGAPDPAPDTTSDTASSRSANAASNDTGKQGIQALALRKMMVSTSRRSPPSVPVPHW